jgi:trimeric autotransporter adhesin
LRIGSTTYVSTNINTISGPTGTPPTGLPVKLSTFNSEIHNSEISLNWNTSSEVNFKDFNIQKSTNGKSFETIGTVNPNLSSLYSFDDLYPKNGLQYYRLQINDVDGSVEYSKIIAVNYVLEKTGLVFPNPSTDRTFYINTSLKNAKLEIYNNQGVKIPSVIQEENGQFKITILENQSQKILLLHINSEGKKELQKIIMN